MRRLLPLLVLLSAGCSNAPIAGFLDNCFPSHAKSSGDPVPPPKPKPDLVGPGPVPPGPAPGPNPGPLPPPDFGP
jgi:hypothetical protein